MIFNVLLKQKKNWLDDVYFKIIAELAEISRNLKGKIHWNNESFEVTFSLIIDYFTTQWTK